MFRDWMTRASAMRCETPGDYTLFRALSWRPFFHASTRGTRTLLSVSSNWDGKRNERAKLKQAEGKRIHE